MALTRTQSRIADSFTQPVVGGVVYINVDPGIDWFRPEQRVIIVGAGVYEIIDIVGFVHQLKLKTAIAPTGQLIVPNLMYPIEEPEPTKWYTENWN